MYTTTHRSLQGTHCNFQVPTVGFPQVDALGKCRAKPCCTSLNLLFQRSNCEGLHNCLCWLCLHLGLLSKHHPGACLCGRLVPGLDAAEAWKSEDAILLDLLCCNRHEAVQDVGTIFDLHVILGCDGFQHGTLCHCLRGTRLHGLHRLHGSHS